LIEAISKVSSFHEILTIVRGRDMFSSKKLSDSFHKSKESFEDYVQNISQVSHDIRFLELLLKNYGLNSPFKSLFAHELKTMARTDETESTKAHIEHHVYEYVSGEINEKEKKPSFRIFYKKYEVRLRPSDEAGPTSCNISEDSKILENRPLVETPVLTRLKIYPYLPTFLEKLAEELSKYKTELNFIKFKHSINEFEKIMKKKAKKTT
jgi:hypothetical protein